ncbi:MAG: hypothetical protein AAGG01_01285 [Planctomycetota bacterium]
MLRPRRFTPASAALPLTLALLSSTPAIAGPRQSGGDDFYRAYYLEHERGDFAAAVKLYEEAAKSGRLSAAQRAEIEAHLAACREELATLDLAALVPADTIVYAELNDPGAQLGALLSQLGLLQNGDRVGQIGISPRLVDGILGLKGAAIAITNIDPTAGMPGGVAVLHPGDMDAVRGLIETALPAGGQVVDPIGGYATYLIEGMVHVTMGERLILASTERGLIEDVLRRVHGDRSDSLAANEEIEATLHGHGDNLLFFCANAEPVMPLLEGALGAAAGQSQEAAMAIQLLDPESLRTVSGSVGVHDDGLALDIGLALDDSHQNVAFNLLRMPHVSETTFDLVPNGVAAFLATSLNQSNPGGTGVTDAQGRPVVSIMDLGREVFGNLVDVALFTLPSMGEGPGGMPMPDAALAMSVNDPERSLAIWRLALGMAQGATGKGGNMAPRREKAGAGTVERFRVEGVEVYLYGEGNRVVLSPSMRAIEAVASGKSVRHDEFFAGLAAEGSSDHTSVLGVSVGRLAQIASQVMPERELREMRPVLELLESTSVIAKTRHSDTELRWNARVTGLPNVGPLVEQFVRAELHGGSPYRRGQPLRTASVAAVEERGADADHWLATGEVQAASHTAPESAAAALSTRATFDALLEGGNLAAARALIPVLASEAGGDPKSQNDLVWFLVSGEHGKALADSLLPIIEGAASATNHEDWYVLDTLAHVQFESGNVRSAIETESKALKIAKDAGDPRWKETATALKRFTNAAKRELVR